MTTPEVLSKVGFEKSKVGSGEKESGYQIKESSLSSLLGSACLCFLIMGLMVVSMVFDVHFEKKTLHRQLRAEEHHAAGKLAQVQMELWKEFHSDIQESNEAQALLKSMNDSYSSLQEKIKAAVHEFSAELVINPIKAEKFTDKLLHIVVDVQQDNTKHAKHLVDHLVAAGKRSVKLEKHIDKQILAEVKEEKKKLAEDKRQGVDVTAPPPPKGETKELPKEDKVAAAKRAEDDEADPLKEMLQGFFFTFNDFENEFKGEARAKLKDGNPEYEKIKVLRAKLNSDEPVAEEDIQKELDKIDLAGVGAGLGSGRVLPVQDIVEELELIPKIPHKKIATLEQKWKKGEIDSVEAFEQVQEMYEKKLVPSGWMQMGVDREEAEEEMEEERDGKDDRDAEEDGDGED